MLKSSLFDDIFGIEATRVVNGSTFNQVTGNSLDFHILNCQFVDMFSNRGSYDLVVVNGVIYFRTTHTINLLVEDCVFCGCSVGGIYFYCSNDGASVMKKIWYLFHNVVERFSLIKLIRFISVMGTKKVFILILQKTRHMHIVASNLIFH